MQITVSLNNKEKGLKRSWTFFISFDYSQFDIEKAKNRLVFCRFNEYDKSGKCTMSYDVDGDVYKNCTWKTVQPSTKIKHKAVEKFLDSFTMDIKNEQEEIKSCFMLS